MTNDGSAEGGPLEIAICGDLAQHEHDIYEKLLGVHPGGECVLYFNSPGGSAYSALSLASLIVLRGLEATGVVIGECSLGGDEGGREGMAKSGILSAAGRAVNAASRQCRKICV